MTDPSFRRPDWPRAPQKSRPHFLGARFLSATKRVAPSQLLATASPTRATRPGTVSPELASCYGASQSTILRLGMWA